MIENFRYDYNYKIEDWSQFVETILEEHGYCYGQQYRKYSDYYLAYNPLIQDNRSMSSQIYIKDGIMLMYNGSIDVMRKNKMVSSNSIPPSEYARILGFFDLYIDFVLMNYDVDLSVMMEYKNSFNEFVLNGNSGGFGRGIARFRKFLFQNFITDSDVMRYNCRKTKVDIIRHFKKPEKKIYKKNEIMLEKPMFFCKRQIEKYCEKRKISFQSNVIPVLIRYENGSSDNGICFNYPNGFKKIRFISEDSPRRYMALSDEGDYQYFFEARVCKSKNCFIVEGEIEALTITNIITDDVYAMHNVNSLPEHLSQLKGYDKIYLRVDFDKFESVKESFYRLVHEFGDKVEIMPKIICYDKKIDYNYLYNINKLNKEMIYKPQIFNEVI